MIWENNNDDYISREEAINSLTEENLVLNLDSVMDGLSNQIKRSAHRILASLPAADVRPVVYCKDCKHRFNYDICAYRGDNWFCGYGERKAENVTSARRES